MTVELIYCDAYADRIASGGAFESAEAAMARFAAYTRWGWRKVTQLRPG